MVAALRLALGAGLLLAASSAMADERILSYDSEIVVHPDGRQTVTETIRVRAEGKHIKRGIYRDFPSVYETPTGLRHRVKFQVVEVQRDGHPEPWHTQAQSNGTRVYIGRGDVHLKPGEYRYQLTYATDRQIGFFDQHDELYWNVTGNGWAFPIDHARARVFLPRAIIESEVRVQAYTGPLGSTASNAEALALAAGAQFQTRQGLGPHEGLTIVVGWPKGHVYEPSAADRVLWLWRDEPALFVVWGGALLLLAYYFLAWHFVGRDPAAGIIIPEYGPPTGYSPAAVRLIRNMGFDHKVFSAALVSLAVKGHIKIIESEDEFAVQVLQSDPGSLPTDEREVLAQLGSSIFKFEPSQHRVVKALHDQHQSVLDRSYRKRYYYTNQGWLLPGWILTAAIVAATAWAHAKVIGFEGIPLLFMLVMGAAVFLPYLKSLWQMRSKAYRTPKAWLQLAANTVFILVISIVMFGDFGSMILNLLSAGLLVGLILLAVVNLAYQYLIKAPTLKGRKLLDHVEGFRQFLSIADGDELRAKYSKPVTPEQFEAYLPYAMALDVETEWGERFANSLRAEGQTPTTYHPNWYHGNSFRGVRGLSASVGSALTSSIASSSRAPGSSSGFGGGGGGGGGFSGGGGGGGGGGGW